MLEEVNLPQELGISEVVSTTIALLQKMCLPVFKAAV